VQRTIAQGREGLGDGHRWLTLLKNKGEIGARLLLLEKVGKVGAESYGGQEDCPTRI